MSPSAESADAGPHAVRAQYQETSHHELEETFRQLADEWHEETGDSSTIEDKIMHRTYQQIIGLGPHAVPLILKELQAKPGHWFWALQAITRENPVLPGASLDEAVDAWLQWGRNRGKI